MIDVVSLRVGLRWLATFLSLGGSRLVASKKKSVRQKGFSVWIIANMIWIFNSVVVLDLPQILLWSIFLYYAVDGWKNNSEEKNEG